MANNPNNNNGPFKGVQNLVEPNEPNKPNELHLNGRKRNEPVFAPQKPIQPNPANGAAKGGRRKKHTRRHKKAKRTRRHRKH